MPTPVDVALGSRSYQVHIGRGLIERIVEFIPRPLATSPCAIVTDSNVGPLYAETLAAQLGAPPVLDVPAGEASKSMAVAESLCDRLIDAGLDRSAFLVALGGGVVGDLAGFVAAIHYRGIPFVQIPTSVVAQVDSAVGGKTGVNARRGKNLIGAFHQPAAVVADTSTLDSLPTREFNEGFAEIVKHAAIRSAPLMDQIAAHRRGDGIDAIIAENVRIKATIVARDEEEKSGTRALLNFGHTLGHAIENAAGYGRFLHGEAIAIGIHAAVLLSRRHAGLPPHDADRILDALRQFDLPLTLPADIPDDALVEAMRRDKKFDRSRIRFVLCPRLGDAILSENVGWQDIRETLAQLRP